MQQPFTERQREQSERMCEYAKTCPAVYGPVQWKLKHEIFNLVSSLFRSSSET